MNSHNHNLRLWAANYFAVVKERQKRGLPINKDYYQMVKNLIMIEKNKDSIFELQDSPIEIHKNLIIKL